MAYLDKIGLTRLWEHIMIKLNQKVDKIEGKVLSTNDYTNEEKNKLASITTDVITDSQIDALCGGTLTEDLGQLIDEIISGGEW